MTIDFCLFGCFVVYEVNDVIVEELLVVMMHKNGTVEAKKCESLHKN